jgi:hypothetical protein
VYLLLYPKEWVAKAAANRTEELFSSLRAIHADHFFAEGRVYGGGLHKMEPSELMRLPADDLVKVLGAKPQTQHTMF